MIYFKGRAHPVEQMERRRRGIRAATGSGPPPAAPPDPFVELAVVEYVSWFNNERLHESLGDVSPAEFEDLYVQQGDQPISPFMKIGSN
jgi:transposase InsO family protein